MPNKKLKKNDLKIYDNKLKKKNKNILFFYKIKKIKDKTILKSF